MKLFLDTNVVLDLVEGRVPFVTDSEYLFQLKKEGVCELVVSDLTLINIAYIARKNYSLDKIYAVLSQLRLFLDVVGIGAEAIDRSLALKARDFEDAVQYYAALQAKADYIISRNKKDFSFSEIEVLTPHEFLLLNHVI